MEQYYAHYGYNTNVTVGIVGRGIDCEDAELDDNYVGGYDLKDNDTSPCHEGDKMTHEDKVALTLTAETNNNEHASGMVNTPFRAYRSWSSDMVETIHRAIDDGCDILSISRYHQYESQELRDAIDRAVSEDVLILMSSGNNGSKKPEYWQYPAVYNECLSVGAVQPFLGDPEDLRVAGYSNYGEAVDLVAPGVGLLIESGDDTHMNFGGTSGSCPVAAGVAAAVQEATGLKGQNLKQRLLSTAQDIGEPEAKQGAGMVDAAEACGLHETEDDGTNNSQTMQTIVIEGTGPAAQYNLSVSGSLEKSTTEVANINTNDTIDGSTASGEVGLAADAYRFDGAVESLEVDGHARVYFQ